jgi:hypothetical protein
VLKLLITDNQTDVGACRQALYNFHFLVNCLQVGRKNELSNTDGSLILQSLKKPNRTYKLDLDMLGASASFLCAIHCALVPLIISFGMLSGLSFIVNPAWELFFIGSSLLIASISLINGYRKHHSNLKPLLTALVGFTIIFVGHYAVAGTFGHWTAVLGGLLVAWAHILNFKACKSCKVCRD